MLHIPPTNYLLLAAKQQLCQKAISLRKILKNCLGKKSRQWPSREKKKEKERKKNRKSNGSRKKNKSGNSKVKSNDSPEIKTGVAETSDIPGLPSRDDRQQVCAYSFFLNVLGNQKASTHGTRWRWRKHRPRNSLYTKAPQGLWRDRPTGIKLY